MERAVASVTVLVRTETGSGSGFFYDMSETQDRSVDWVILTNARVVRNYSTVEVCFVLAQACHEGRVMATGGEDFDVAVVRYGRFGVIADTSFFDYFEGWGGDWSKGDVVYASGYPGGT